MKKLVSIILLIFMLQISNLKAQKSASFRNLHRDDYVFWFFIKAENKIDRILKKPMYQIRRSSKEIKSGKIKKYEKEVYRNLNSGNLIAIGPFLELVDAKRANEMYNLARKTDEQMEKIISETKDTTDNYYFWYLLQFSVSDRTHKYLIKRQPARIAEGNLVQFRQILWDVRVIPQLTIGPFTSREEAEESKRLYRLEDDY